MEDDEINDEDLPKGLMNGCLILVIAACLVAVIYTLIRANYHG